MKTFRTTFSIPESGNKISHRHKLAMIGSCFAQEMGEKMQGYSFDISLNPFGILFNPISISIALDRIMENKKIREEELVQDGKMFHSLLHHGSYSRSAANEALDLMNAEIKKAHHHLLKSDFLIVTFGSAWSYKWKISGEVVANCHKIPQENFEKVLLEHTIIEKEWEQRISQLRSFNPDLKVIFSVSPVRYLRDGITGNQLSKGHLLIAANNLCKSTGHSYFPSYELLMDDLRDYRFYKPDMLHPSEEAIEYIWQTFGGVHIHPRTLELMRSLEKYLQMRDHRSISENEIESRDRKNKAQEGIDEILSQLRNV